MTLPTQLPIIEILRTSSSKNSANFAFWGFSEVRGSNLPHSGRALDHRGGAMPNFREFSFYSGQGSSPIHSGPLLCLVGKHKRCALLATREEDQG